MTFISNPKPDDAPRTAGGTRDLAKTIIKAVIPHSWIHAVLRTRRTPIAHVPKPATLSKSSIGTQTLSGAVIRRFDFAWLCETLTKMPDVPPFFFTNQRDAKPSICYMEPVTKRMVEALTDVAAAYDLVVSAVVDSKITHLRTFEDVLYTVAAARVTDLKLTLGNQDINFRMEVWVVKNDVAVAPRGNIYTRKIYLADNSGGRAFLDRKGADLADLFDQTHESEFDHPIDVVYTWVDGADPDWQKLYIEHALPLLTNTPAKKESAAGTSLFVKVTGDIMQDPEIFDRYASRDELKYSLRSVDRFLPWVRNIIIVSNCRPPAWLDTKHPRIRWIDHSEILDPQYLPTFNSHAIESGLHKIPGLSRHFLYFNDDFFVLQSMEARDFFTSNGLAVNRLESYGMVHGDVKVGHESYLNAARNVQKLLEKKFGKTATRLHTHTPATIRVDVQEQAETDFADAFHITRSNRLRSITDINPTSFLAPHYHFMSGNAVNRKADYRLVKRSAPFQKLFDSYINGIGQKKSGAPSLICVNDGGGSTSDEVWNTAVESFLEQAFQWPCQFEKTCP